ncbi:MAG: hypothetical protein CM15mP74_24460 [Halieaceae bacterium]|nr:MAG: hypothetical protein CM15mP74_24460 [Halieaceae bacterium]
MPASATRCGRNTADPSNEFENAHSHQEPLESAFRPAEQKALVVEIPAGGQLGVFIEGKPTESGRLRATSLNETESAQIEAPPSTVAA